MFVFQQLRGLLQVLNLCSTNSILIMGSRCYSLACRCANATRSRGWKVFGIQFYGECWSDESGESTYNKYGEAPHTKCIQELVTPQQPCDKNKDLECVGAQNTNYVYMLKNGRFINLVSSHHYYKYHQHH